MSPRATLPKSYDPAEVEGRLYAWWEASGHFHARPDDAGEPYAIAYPLPNVTGGLHIGHALTTSIQDAFIRAARMRGRNAVWLTGMDHAGIATQNVVERQLAAKGLTRHDLGRDAFVDRVWAFKEESGGQILHQLRRLGAAMDWQREAFTLDEPRSRAVRETFCRLFDEGLIYRGLRLINWDPVNQTALSDIEVDHEMADGTLTYVRYAGADGSEGVVVATTRPETMLGDTAVAVSPDDERYRHLVGSSVILPLLERAIPVIADAHVDPEFGTGAVKITPAHDFDDYAVGQRHGLDAIDVMTDDGHINAAGGPYEGLDRFEARERVVSDLRDRGLLVRTEPHQHALGLSSRSRGVVEPRLSEQWFVAVDALASRAAQAVRDGRTRFVPERNAKGFLDWLDNLHDWCISRQLWWGHRIPVWYDADGSLHALRHDPDPDEIARLGLTHQDPDVLDTWFSSQLWPMTTLGWTGGGRDETPDLATWYPNAVMETGYDINTFWVSRMLMIGLHLLDEVPFRVVFNHGMVRDERGKKMSKSFGNVIDPLDFIDRYGADALRFALLRSATPGVDVPLAEEWVEGARRFTNKLWNAGRFVLARRDGTDADVTVAPVVEALEDRWILSRLEATRAAVAEAYDALDLSRAGRALYHFTWDEFCDWYLELAKLRDDDAARATLGHVLDATLRLSHPLMPFITEELWQALHGCAGERTILREPLPAAAPAAVDAAAEAAFAAVVDVVSELRRFRADHGLAPSARIDVVAVVPTAERAVLEGAVDGIRRLGGVGEWRFADTPPAGDGGVGKVVTAGAELYVPLAGLVDLGEERRRLERERDKARVERDRAERKLANAGFVANAPAAVVDAERRKAADWEAAITQLDAQLDT